MNQNKYVYFFNKQKNTDGASSMSQILGGKGANLAEMANLNIPVPPGFTISTDVCVYYMKHGKYPPGCKMEIKKNLKKLEVCMGQRFGSVRNPLLVSVRSGARQSMPGMMETVLNVGLTDQTLQGLINQTGNKRFSYDSYRRLIMMFADVVMDKSKNNNYDIRYDLEKKLEEYKKKKKIENDTSLDENDLSYLCKKFQNLIFKKCNDAFPNNALEQLESSIEAVFISWNGKRAKDYRKIEKIPDHWGTAVNVQAMVFGNMGNDSATGVAFTRHPSTGENYFFGEWLPNAQGEDVVAGIRTPYQINNYYKKTNNTLENKFPEVYKQLFKIQKKLETHYQDMQDIEFTIQKNNLWLLQTRVGKRNGQAAIKIALDLLKNKKITAKQALSRISSNHITELLLPSIDNKQEEQSKPIAVGLPAGPGAATGQIVFDSDKAEKLFKKGKKIILVREETSPEDVHGMFASEAILTSRGGMTSHAALVARGWGKCCIVGCNDIKINFNEKTLTTNNCQYKENDWLTLNGSIGNVYDGKLKLQKRDINKNQDYNKLMQLCKKYNLMKVRANADQAKDAAIAKGLGAKGIGLCRTEHMFFNPKRIKIVRKMIIAKNDKERNRHIQQLLPYQQKDFYKLFKTMSPFPVTIRLLDPPLHEFLPIHKSQIEELAYDLNASFEKINHKIESLKELNPMLGHRGCRLGITFPEITVMQTSAIIKAAIQLSSEGISVKPEIMIPLVGSFNEFLNQKLIIKETAESLLSSSNTKIKYLIGTMIELPRACLIADKIAEKADFISFGTNDLTQTTFGFSRDDIGSFLPDYLAKDILRSDPFATLDTVGVGALIKIAIKNARAKNPKIKIGVCGEHGGDPKSIQFFNSENFDYVSCSAYRMPVAYLSIAKNNC